MRDNIKELRALKINNIKEILETEHYIRKAIELSYTAGLVNFTFGKGNRVDELIELTYKWLDEDPPIPAYNFLEKNLELHLINDLYILKGYTNTLCVGAYRYPLKSKINHDLQTEALEKLKLMYPGLTLNHKIKIKNLPDE